jgi:hypothetical protein
MLKAIWKIKVCMQSLKHLLKWKHDEPSRLGSLYFGKEHENVEDAWTTRNGNKCKGFKCQHIVQSLHVEL